MYWCYGKTFGKYINHTYYTQNIYTITSFTKKKLFSEYGVIDSHNIVISPASRVIFRYNAVVWDLTRTEVEKSSSSNQSDVDNYKIVR